MLSRERSAFIIWSKSEICGICIVQVVWLLWHMGKLHENMTSPKCRAVHQLSFWSFQLIYIIFSGPYVSVQLLFLCSIGKASVSPFLFRLTFFLCPSVLCYLSDSCKLQPARVCLRVIHLLDILGCQLDEDLHIVKKNNCLWWHIAELCQPSRPVRSICGNISCFSLCMNTIG